MNMNDNTVGIEVEAPPTMMRGESADDIEQLPIANDDYDNDVVNNLPPNSRHASKKYIVGAIFVVIAAFAAFFGIGMGSGYGITNAVNKSANEAASVSSASSMALTASNGAKAGKVAKSIKTSTTKSSKSKSGKSVTTTTTTSTTPATTTTTSCPPVVVSRSNLMLFIPDGTLSSSVIQEVSDGGCGCIVANVAIAIGITHTRVGDLQIGLFSPDGESVILVYDGGLSANLVSTELITFDDSTLEKNPLTLGDTDPIPADTYNAQGSLDGSGEYPNPDDGLARFNTKNAVGDWDFTVRDAVAGNIGFLESVELTITCL